jgi:hypothetical protein
MYTQVGLVWWGMLRYGILWYAPCEDLKRGPLSSTPESGGVSTTAQAWAFCVSPGDTKLEAETKIKQTDALK